MNWPAAVWLLGCTAAAGWFLLGAVRTGRMARRSGAAAFARHSAADLATALGIAGPVRVLASAEALMPLTWGILRPVVILPADAALWPEARLDAVLLHEMIHVRRRDVLAQAVAQAACCLYWFHPVAWMALRRLRLERERACDDAVLLRGLEAHDYAGHLMDIVREVGKASAGQSHAPAMAEFSDLESRVRALLDPGRKRGPVSRRAALTVTAAVCAILLPMAAITAYAQARSALAGVVQDPSGARVPGCQVTAVNLDGTNQETTRANAAGEYLFASIPPGRYALEFRARGFAVLKTQAALTAGIATRADGQLSIGQISESVQVRGQKPPAPTPAPTPLVAPQRIRVGGMVQAAKLISQVRPEYPADLQRAGVQGTIMMQAIISKTGDLLVVEVKSASANPELANAALAAVRQWHYEPTLLNGEPVEVITTITVDFTLE